MFREKVDNKQMNKLVGISTKVLQIVFILVLILLILVATYLIKEWHILGFVKTLLEVVSPVFIGFVLAWLLDPIASRLAKKMPRSIACIITYLGILIIVVAVLWLLIPSIASGISEVVNMLPSIFDQLQDWLNNIFSADNSFITEYKTEILSNIENIGRNMAETLPNNLINAVRGLVSGGTNIILGIMIGFYLLFDYKKARGHILSFLPNTWHDSTIDLMKRINGKLRSYVQGVLGVMSLVFITQLISFSIVGLRAPVLFALFCAITDIIPYIGPWIGGIPAVLVGFTMDPSIGIFCIIAILICQLLENNFYQPLIMGKTMKIHPVTVMLGLLIFNHFFGMIGMIVATPVIACIKIIFEFVEEKTGLGQKFKIMKDKPKEEPTKKTLLQKFIKNK